MGIASWWHSDGYQPFFFPSRKSTIFTTLDKYIKGNHAVSISEVIWTSPTNYVVVEKHNENMPIQIY